MGVCIEKLDSKAFLEAIRMISDNFDTFSQNAVSFYNNDNKTEIVRKALVKKSEI